MLADLITEIPGTSIIQTQGVVVWFSVILLTCLTVIVGLLLRNLIASNTAILAKTDESDKWNRTTLMEQSKSIAGVLAQNTAVIAQITKAIDEMSETIVESNKSTSFIVNHLENERRTHH